MNPSDHQEQTIRILHVFGRMTRGGAEMRTLELMQSVQGRGYHMSFCVLSGMAGELDDAIRSMGGDVYPVPLGILFPRRFRELLREHRFDVVHSHVHLVSGYILRLARKEGVPKRIAHFRNTQDGHDLTLVRRLRNWLLKSWIDNDATDILGVCAGVMQEVWGNAWQTDPRCRVIYNGIALEDPSPRIDRLNVLKEFDFPSNARLIVHVGRMARQKNHLRLLDIFAAIYKKAPDVCLLLVGREETSIETALRDRIAELRLNDSVRIAGERKDVRRLLGAADLLLFPSLWEGLPGVVLEACASGTPVLASGLPGVLEIQGHFTHQVQSLALRDNNDVWADTALRILETWQKQWHQPPMQDFNLSIFSIRHCQQQMCQVWNFKRGVHG